MQRSALLGEGSVLVCRVGAQLCALPLAAARETLRPLPVVALDGQPPFVAGVAIVRGAPTPVVDAARLLGTDAPPPERFVVLACGARRIALAVSAVVGARVFPPGTLAAAPPVLRDAAAGAIEALARVDAELVVVLAATRLVPSSAWAAIDGGAA